MFAKNITLSKKAIEAHKNDMKSVLTKCKSRSQAELIYEIFNNNIILLNVSTKPPSLFIARTYAQITE